ncbi:DUF3078 domain-containing protein [Bacteroidota bacterium]
MKAIRLIPVAILIFSSSSFLNAQENPDTSYWSHSGKAGLTFAQVGFSNWAGGGEPSVSFNGLVYYSLKFEKSPHLWQTVLDAGYGAQRLGKSSLPFKKTDDNLVLTTRYGYKISKKWYLSALGNLRTQFYEGYNYDADTAILVSNFMSPAYSKIGIGITFNHKFAEKESFSFTFSPVNVKTTFVLDDTLSARGMYGIEPGKKVRFRGGMDLLVAFSKELVKNITLTTTLSMFTPYEDFAVVDVNWDMAIWFKINEYFSASINTQLIYDQDIGFVNDAGQKYNSAIQFKEVLGIGLIYNF